MFEVLGDKQAQEEIRLAHPEVAHCDKLPINARACIGCGLNPMKPEKLAKRERIEAGAIWIEAARELEEQSRFGLLGINSIDSTELILLSAARQQHDFQRDERLAILIRNHMAEYLNKAWGPK